MQYCKLCGFPLGTRPGLIEKDGVCQACINQKAKKAIDFKERQRWLTEYIKKRGSAQYNAVIAVSGGKDSHAIVERLVNVHGLTNALLVTVTDEFTHTQAGAHNVKNIAERYNFDHLIFRCQPQTFKEETKKDFFNELHPLKWIEEKIYSIPLMIAKKFGVKLVFFGENPAFEYGTTDKLDILHPASTPDCEIIFMGAIWPYSITDSLEVARSVGFKDLDDFKEWPRQGSIDQYTQIDSIAYIIQLWTKYVKFGFQRVADIACRMVREGKLSKEKARALIDKHDHICDPMAKADFCKTIGISEKEFDDAVATHANKAIVELTSDGWKVKA